MRQALTVPLHMRPYLKGEFLMGAFLMGAFLMGVFLMGAFLMGVFLMLPLLKRRSSWRLRSGVIKMNEKTRALRVFCLIAAPKPSQNDTQAGYRRISGTPLLF